MIIKINAFKADTTKFFEVSHKQQRDFSLASSSILGNHIFSSKPWSFSISFACWYSIKGSHC